MKPKILIITTQKDITVDYIINKYKETTFFRVNTDLIGNYQIKIQDKDPFWEIQFGNTSINNLETLSIYYRKPLLPKLEEYDKNFRDFMRREIVSVIDGIVESFPGKCLTKPSILIRADNKILQLSLAKRVGFQIPSSLITNSTNIAKEFTTKQKSIIKPISIGKIYENDLIRIIQTNIVEERITMNNLEYCPSYFQEYKEKDYEVRATIIGKEIFAVRLDTQYNKETLVDWRRKPELVKYSIIQLPQEIETKCFKLLRILNLDFGAFDFIVSNHEYIFLEVNANGQWGWLEGKLGINISGSIIKYLKEDRNE